MSGFQIKNFVSIVASMINHMKGTQKQVTDFRVGSVIRTLVEAPAIEIEELYQQMFNGLNQAIPVSTYRSFNFETLPAVAASGLIQLVLTSSTEDVVIAAGTVFKTDGTPLTYLSAEDVIIEAGDTAANILVISSVSSSAGNIEQGKTFTVNPVPAGFVSASNAISFLNGRDKETPDQQKQRFNDYIATLQRGTKDAIVYGLKTAALFNSSGVQTERVAAASVVEPYVDDVTEPTGLVNAYVHNGVGGTSADLVALAQKITDGYTDAGGTRVPGWKAAGVVVNVYASTEVELDVTGVITAKNGYSEDGLIALAGLALATYITSLDNGGQYIRATAIALVMAIPGVANFVPSLPASDLQAEVPEKFIPGTFTLTGPA